MNHAMDTAAAVSVLLGTRGTSDRAQRERVFSELVRCFWAFNVAIVGQMRGALLIQNANWPYGDVWAIGDNGGELNMERINSGQDSLDVPYLWWSMPLDGGTVAHRVRCVLDGKPIDYDYKVDKDMLEILLAGRPS
jgi:hypothetical protein